ncbi:MAG TPA: hypothetical protein EYQ50_19125 [Verrucomicrobiales bacterium]|nr:hypothetical protein [Verrucomicrobiales bacterium]
MRLLSYDVFDTLITRCVGQPADLFILLGIELAQQDLFDGASHEFVHCRCQAERDSRDLHAHREVQLDEIYSKLAAELNWDETQKKQALEAEIRLELECLEMIPSAKQHWEKHRKWADRVLFLSDMYLPASVIRTVLNREGFQVGTEDLFVSGDTRCSKGSGKLFDYVRNRFTQVTEWRHYGDNSHGDLKMASRNGIKAVLLPDGRLTRLEQLAVGGASAGSLWESYLAGSMRSARLKASNTETAERHIQEVGAQVTGPLLFSFVHWCLESAQLKGLKRLYFVSRDGQILHRIAERIVKAWGIPVECRYLYGSRQAWHPAALETVSETELKWIVPDTPFLSFQQVLKHVGIDSESMAEVTEWLPGIEWDLSSNLSLEQRSELRQRFLESEFRRNIEKSCLKKRNLVMDYLQSEGILDSTPKALVDIGWRGNLLVCLKRIFDSQKSHTSEEKKLHGFFFGLVTDPVGVPMNDFSAYWSCSIGQDSLITEENLALFEIFTAADHGSVAGYLPGSHAPIPELVETVNSHAVNWGVKALQKSVLEFTDRFLSRTNREHFISSHFQERVINVYHEFYRKPDPNHSRTWGKISFSDQQVETTFQGLTPKWSRFQLLRAIFIRKYRPDFWWMEAQYAADPFFPLFLFIQVKNWKRRLKRILHRRSIASP